MFQIRNEQLATMRRKQLGDTLIERLLPFLSAGWDAQEKHLLLRDESGPRGTVSFDALGYLGGYTSPLGRNWYFRNAPDGKLLEFTSPSRHVLSMGYDPEGLLAAFASTTQAQIQLRYQLRRYTESRFADETAEFVAYTEAGDPAIFRSRLGTQVSCLYDEFRRLTRLTDGSGHTTQFVYDRWNRPSAVLHPNGQRDEFTYTEEGLLLGARQGAAAEATIQSDPLGRPLQLRYSDGLELAFTYNEAGLLTEASDATGSATFAYNEDGQFLAEEAGPYQHTLAYDAARRLLSIASLGAQVSFRWDADSRLIGVTDWFGGEHLLEYLPNDRGHVYTGPAEGGGVGVRSFVRTDTAGRLAELQVTARGESRFALACAYDVEGRLNTSIDDAFGRRVYGYDVDSHVVYAETDRGYEAFAYDRAGNIAAVNGARRIYDAANQLLDDAGTALRWDDRGNLVEVAGPAGTQRFRYNQRNQMTASVAADGTETRYTYDALGRRTRKRTGEKETRFFWAGEQMTCEIRADLATGTLQRQDFLYHPETGVPLLTAVDGEVYAIHTDHLGTPRAVTSKRGEVVWLAELSSYGVAQVTVARVAMPLRFRGQYHDAETGLHYNRFRYYAPRWGRYCSRDPLTFAANTNHYSYVDGNPVNATDASGLITWKTVAVIGASVAVGAAVIAFAPVALPLAILAAGIAGGAVAGGLNEALNEKHFCLMCIVKAAGLGALAGGVGALPFLALPVGAGLLAFAGAGALGGALSYGVNCLDGAEKNPSWGGLAGSVALGGVFGAAGKGVGDAFGGTPEGEPPPVKPEGFDEVYSKAPAAKEEIDAKADAIAEGNDGTVAKAPIKSEARAIEKINSDYDGDPTRIKDLARNTIIVPQDRIPDVTSALQEQGAKVKVIDGATDPLGYSGVNSTIMTEAGIPGEIQVNSPEMIYGKESEPIARSLLGDETYDNIAQQTGVPGGQGHALYEQWRVLDSSTPEAQSIAQQSQNYYNTIRGGNGSR